MTAAEYLNNVKRASLVLGRLAGRCEQVALSASVMSDGTVVRPVTAEDDWRTFAAVRDEVVDLLEQSRPTDA